MYGQDVSDNDLLTVLWTGIQDMGYMDELVAPEIFRANGEEYKENQRIITPSKLAKPRKLNKSVFLIFINHQR